MIATLAGKGRAAFRIELKDVPYILLLATIGIPLEFFLQVWSQGNTTATNFTLIYDLSTFFIMFLSLAFLGEKLTRDKVTGSVIAFAGLGVIITNGSATLSPGIYSDTIALAGCVVWALYTAIGKCINEKYSALAVLNYVFALGALELLPFFLR
jgi:drug/metabolite transporter (DMT)-like permease